MNLDCILLYKIIVCFDLYSWWIYYLFTVMACLTIRIANRLNILSTTNYGILLSTDIFIICMIFVAFQNNRYSRWDMCWVECVDCCDGCCMLWVHIICSTWAFDYVVLFLRLIIFIFDCIVGYASYWLRNIIEIKVFYAGTKCFCSTLVFFMFGF